MSSVLKNRRSISELEFFQNAIALRTELTKFILNDKNVPKSYRLYFALPMKSKLTALMDNITAANTIYPINEHELEQRRDYQTKAIIVCEQILQELQLPWLPPLFGTADVEIKEFNGVAALAEIAKELGVLADG